MIHTNKSNLHSLTKNKLYTEKICQHLHEHARDLPLDGLELFKHVNVALIKKLRTFREMLVNFELIVDKYLLNGSPMTVCNGYSLLQKPLFRLIKGCI